MEFAFLCPNNSRFLWLCKMSCLMLGPGMLLVVFGNVYLYEEFNLKTELPRPAPVVQMPKLLSEERLRNLFTYDGIWWDITCSLSLNLAWHLSCSSPPILQMVPYLLEPVLADKVIPNCETRKGLGIQGTVSVLYSSQLSPLKLWRVRLTKTTGMMLPFRPSGLLFWWGWDATGIPVTLKFKEVWCRG